jgi:hypothetical protein
MVSSKPAVLLFGPVRGLVVYVDVETSYTIGVVGTARFPYLHTDRILSRWHHQLTLVAAHHARDL